MLVVIYTGNMAKKKKQRKDFKLPVLSKRARLVVLPIMILIAAGVIVFTILAIVVMPLVNPGTQRGVGADGFKAYEESGTSVGAGNVITKEQVVAELGDRAKSVDDADVSNVFNLNGIRRQQATYDFVRADGAKANLYVDVTLFNNTASMRSANVLEATADAGKIQGHPAYYMRAFTFGSDREYRLLVVNGLKAYVFAISQPVRDIEIREVSALAVLKRLAAKAEL